MTEVETDTEVFFNGAVRLKQPLRGYRVNIDSLHLVHFAARFPARESCDLGAGSGLLGLGLLALQATTSVVAIEREPIMAKILAHNFVANGHRDTTHCMDVADFTAHALFGLVVCNPPYFDAGRAPRDVHLQGARFGPVEPFLQGAARSLRARGRLALCYPAAGLTTLIAALHAVGFEAKVLQLVYGKHGAAARIVLVLAQRARPGLQVLPPRYDHPA